MDDLTTLLREAVEDVEPTDRRAELRELVAVSSRSRHRRYAITGGLLAAAVVVTGVAVAVQQSDEPETQPADSKHAVDRSREHRPAYALYYVGETPQGPRLFREFRDGPGPETTPAAAISLLLSPPDDPDYESYWSAGQLLGATIVNGVIEVDVDPALVAGPPRRPGAPAGHLHRPGRGAGRRTAPGAVRPRRQPGGRGRWTADERTSRQRSPARRPGAGEHQRPQRTAGGRWTPSAPTAGPAPSRATCPGSCRDADGTVVREGTAQTYG